MSATLPRPEALPRLGRTSTLDAEPGTAEEAHVEQREVHQQRDDSSGDYEYDQAHEQPAGGPRGHAPQGRSSPAPAGRRPPEPDGDMSYDEAHDF